MRKAINECHACKFCSAHQSQFWKLNKEVISVELDVAPLSELNNDGGILPRTQLCEKFIKHLLTSGVHDVNDLSVSNVPSYIKHCTTGLFILKPMDTSEVKSIIDSLKSDTASGPDHIKPWRINCVASLIASPLQHLYPT